MRFLTARRVFTGVVAFAAAVLAGLPYSVAQSAAQSVSQDSLDRDYSADLPRIAPTEPKKALATFSVAKGFRLEQVAAEPQVADPIALAFDENGRLYVVEMRGYSEERDDKLSRIRLLEDTDGDGRFDKSEVFVDGLAWPTAIHCWEGGVLVADAPDVFYFKDTNGDNRADQRKVLFTGFGRSNVQGLVNSFLWGLDNRIYGATSSSGAEVTSPNVPKEGPLLIRGRDFAIEPRSMSIAPVSGGAQHGLSMNDWGERFVSSNSDHIQQVMYEDRYLARNPYLAAPAPRRSIAADGPQADVFRTSPVEPWRIIRTRLRVSGMVKGPIEGGGRAAGYFTGATGVTIYRGDAWPAEWSGLAIVGDVGSNLVHRKKLSPQGVGYTATRIDEKSEFITSSDNWFRPVQFANGPDGTLYVCDMYREVIEHPASIPPLLKKHIDLTSGRDRGRIYRVVPDGFKQRPLPKLGSASVAELVATLEHANGWHRDTAARLIYQRQDRKAVPLLEQLVAKGRTPQSRIHAAYALDGLNSLSTETLLQGLRDEHPRVRQHAVRLAEKATDAAEVRTELVRAADDPELVVRYQAAFSLGAIPAAMRIEPLVELARKGAGDPYVRVAILSSLHDGAGEALARLTNEETFCKTPAGQEMLRSLAAQIGRQQRPEDIATVLQTLGKLPKERSATLQLLVQALAAKADGPLARQIAAATGGRAAEVMQAMLADAQKAAVDHDRKLAERVAAVAQLRLGTYSEQRDLFAELLEPMQPADVQAAALTALAAFDTPEIADLLLSRYQAFSPRLKSQATDVLLSRGAWVLSLLAAVEKGVVATGDLEASRLKLLTESKDQNIRSRATALLGKAPLSRRADVIAAYQDSLRLKGDAARGQEAFKKICAACHKLQGSGNELGPNLAAMKARGPEAILLNVLDPNREVNPQYLTYALLTTDGRTLSGMISAETATSVTLRRADNASDTVLRIEIEQLKSTGQSLMPEGLEKQIDKQTMADLFEFLRTVE